MTETSDRKFQDGDLVIHNDRADLAEKYNSDACVIGIYTAAGKSRGDWAYTVEFTGGHCLDRNGGKLWRTQVWGWTLKNTMFKYDPKQAGDTDDDV